MNLQFYIEKLIDSEEFEKFSRDYPDAYLATGFFVIDKEGKDNRVALDYYSPEKKELFSFNLCSGGEIGPEKVPEVSEDYVPVQLIADSDLEFEEIERMILEKKPDAKIQKIILSLQNLEGKDLWVCTVFVSKLGLVKVNIDDKEKKVVDFEEKSFMDMMNVFGKK